MQIVQSRSQQQIHPQSTVLTDKMLLATSTNLQSCGPNHRHAARFQDGCLGSLPDTRLSLPTYLLSITVTVTMLNEAQS